MRKSILIMILIFGMDLISSIAYGASFMVRPMMIEATVKAGQRLRIPIEVRNNSADSPRIFHTEALLLDLTQNLSGFWQAIESLGENNIRPIASAKNWMSLKQTELSVSPMEIGTLEVFVDVPLNARGFYCTAVLVQEKIQEGVSVRAAFLIPILLEIQGRPVRQNVQLTGVALDFQAAKPEKAATTLAAIDVENQGLTVSKLSGKIRVDALVNNRWIKVTIAELRKLRIIPGVKLHLTADLTRRLPSGKYKVTGELSVDGRRLKPMVIEIEFQGDPTVDRIAVDSALILNPLELFITAAPGAMRTTTISLENASPDPVDIETASLIPDGLQGVAIGDLKGDELSCAEWVKISPPTFRIRGGGKQNVRVVTQIPKENTNHPNYYGLLKLTAKYPDGQSAGQTQSLVCLSNKAVENKYEVKVINVALAAGEGGKYYLRAQCANTGNVHYTPDIKANLETGIGELIAQTVLTGDTSLMLPMAVRDFAGELNFENVKPGAYRLVSTFRMTSDKSAKQLTGIEVKEENGEKIVQIIELNKEEEPKTEEKPAPAAK